MVFTHSKLLSEKKRQNLLNKIKQQALGIGIGWVSHELVDRHGLTWAVQKSMEQAVAQINIGTNEVIIDGNFNFLKVSYPQAKTVVKADQEYPCVSAASIIAKVSRDLYMKQISKLYPQYGFDSHVGYGTTRHKESIKQNGPCEIHRKSYKPFLQNQFAQANLV